MQFLRNRKREGESVFSGAWHDCWGHVSARKLKYKLEVTCNMPYDRASKELAWLVRFHAQISGLKSMKKVCSHIGQVRCPLVVT